MKFCVKCGKQIKKEAKFCVYCGAAQPEFVDTATDATEPVNAVETEKQTQPLRQTAAPVASVAASNNRRNLIIGIAVVVLVVLGVVGRQIYSTYQRNNLTQQEIADIGATIVDQHLSGAETSYSKTNNTLYVTPDEDSRLYDRVTDVLAGYESPSKLSSVRSQLKKISSDLAPKMPTASKDVDVELLNPKNTNLRLYTASEGTITYDYVKAGDD